MVLGAILVCGLSNAPGGCGFSTAAMLYPDMNSCQVDIVTTGVVSVAEMMPPGAYIADYKCFEFNPSEPT